MDLPAYDVALRRTDNANARLESALRGLTCDSEEETVYFGQ